MSKLMKKFSIFDLAGRFVCNEFTWYGSIQAIQKVVG